MLGTPAVTSVSGKPENARIGSCVASLTVTSVPPAWTNAFRLSTPACVMPPVYFAGSEPARRPLSMLLYDASGRMIMS